MVTGKCGKKVKLTRELVQLAAEISELLDPKRAAEELRHENTASALDGWIQERVVCFIGRCCLLLRRTKTATAAKCSN